MKDQDDKSYDEIVIPGGHTIIRPKYPVCEKCGEEMDNVMFYGWVCISCPKD